MKKLFLLFAALMVMFVSKANMTVYFENTGNWSAVAVHYWGGSSSTNWPGTNITNNKITATNGTTYYYASVPDNSSVIFNNNVNSGAQQTKDLTGVVSGNVYSYAKNTNNGGTIDAIGTITESNGTYVFKEAGAVEIPEGYFYFPVASFNVEQAYLYTWSPGITDGWPGDKLTKETINGTEYWVYTGDAREMNATFGGIQLNNGGSSNQKEQTNIALKNLDVIDISTGVIGNDPNTFTPDIDTSLKMYVIGDNVNGQNWALGTNPMTKTGDGTYEWSGTTLGNKFKINDGTWDATYNIGMGDDGKIKIGVPYHYYMGDGSGDIEFDGFTTVTNPKIVLDMNAGTITLTGETDGGSDTPVTPVTLYLRSDDNDWGTTNPFTYNDNGTYTLSIDKLSGKFKIASEDWNTVNLGFNTEANAVIGDNTVTQGANGNLVAGNWTNVEMTLTYTQGETQGTLNIKADVSTEVVIPDAYYFRSSINEWGEGLEMIKQAEMAGGGTEYVYTLKQDNIPAGTQFKLTTAADGWAGEYGAKEEGASFDGQNTLEAVNLNNSNFTITPDLKDVTINFYYNPDANSSSWVQVLGTVVEEEGYPETMYVIGTLKDGTWNPQVGTKMTTGENGIYSVEGVELVAPDEYGAMFSFCTQLSSDSSWNLGTRYGAAVNSGDDVKITSGSTYTLVKDGDPKPYVGTAGTYSITVDLAKMEMTATWVEASEPEMAVNDFKAVSENVEETTADIVVSYTVENAPENAKYTVYYQEANGEEQSVEATATGVTINLTDLTAATEYTYAVSLAVNDEEVADVEASVNFTTKNASSEEPTPEVGPFDVTFDFTSYDNLKIYSPNVAPMSEWTVDSPNSYTSFSEASNEGIVITADGGAGKTVVYYNVSSSSTTNFRAYKDYSFTITAPENGLIYSIAFTGTSANKVSCDSGEVTGSTSSCSWTAPEGGVHSVTFTATNTFAAYKTMKIVGEITEQPTVEEKSVTLNFTGVEDAYTHLTAIDIDLEASEEDYVGTPYELTGETMTYKYEDMAGLKFTAAEGYTVTVSCEENAGGDAYMIDNDADGAYSVIALFGATDVTFDIAVTEKVTVPDFGPDTYTVYANGVVNSELVNYSWWEADWDYNTPNPEAGNPNEVFSFKSSTGGAAASMGLFMEAPQNTGIFHDATLNFQWYANTAATYTVRLTMGSGASNEFNYPLNVTEDDLNKWNTVSFNVKDQFPALAEGWNNNVNSGKGYVFSVIMEGGTEESVIYFNNVYYSGVDNDWEAPQIEIPEPEDVPVPTTPASDVYSVLSYYGNNLSYNIGWWGQGTDYSTTKIDGQDVMFLRGFDYLGLVDYNIDISDYEYMHVDYWTDSENTPFGFTPISNANGTTQEKTWNAETVTANDWNSYDAPLSYFADGGVDLSTIFQMKFVANQNGGSAPYAYIANVYFWKEPAQEDLNTLYLMAEVNDWKANKEYAFTYEDGKYTLSLESLDGAFKVANSDWSIDLGGEGEYGSDAPVDAKIGDNNLWPGSSVNLVAGNWTNVTFTLDYQEGVSPAVLNIQATVINPDAPDALYLMGDVDGFAWATNQGIKAENVDGVYTWTNVTVDGSDNGYGYINLATVLASEEKDWDAVNAGDRYGAVSGNTPLAPGETAEIKLYAANVSASGTQSWKLAAGAYNITADLNTMEISVEAYEENVTYMLVGPIFLNSSEEEMTANENGEYVYLGEVQRQTFYIQKLVNGVAVMNYGPAGTDNSILNEGNYSGKESAPNAENFTPWVISAVIIPNTQTTGELQFTFNPETMVLNVTKGENVGVDGIDAEAGEAEYYTLSGIKVANPVEGQIYIKVQNGKASKVIL